jgi:RNA polymerase sigma-70 factor (ECF subfamily)
MLPLASPALAALGDEEVVARVLAGDAPLFEILMRRYNQRLFRVARAILGDDDEAEDVMQEAYVRAFHELGGFRGEARFSTWLTRIAVHEALARGRKRRRLAPVPLPAESGGDGEGPPEPPATGADADPERAAANRELAEALRAAVESLPEPWRAVFVMRDVEGLSTEETAAALGITPENAKVRLHRARAALRRHLDDRIGREVRRLYLFHAPRCDRVVATVFARLAVR